MARPLKEIDEETVRRLARIQCTAEEIAAVCGCHRETLMLRFSDVIKGEREAGKSSLRRLQWRSAARGSVAMLIWLGKQHLGQRDGVEQVTGRGADFAIGPDPRVLEHPDVVRSA